MIPSSSHGDLAAEREIKKSVKRTGVVVSHSVLIKSWNDNTRKTQGCQKQKAVTVKMITNASLKITTKRRQTQESFFRS